VTFAAAPGLIPAGSTWADKVDGIADALVAEHESYPGGADGLLETAVRPVYQVLRLPHRLPQCFCETCVLEDNLWVQSAALGTPFPAYHLIRAYHTVAKCVGCTECERACPADIPLTVLYTLLRRDAEETLGYVPAAVWTSCRAGGGIGARG